MAISLRSSTPIAAPPTAAPARGPAASSAVPPHRWPEVAGTNLLFGAFLLLIFLEYTGLASQIPPLRVSKFTTLLALGLVVSVTMKVPRLDLFQYTQTRLLAAFAFMTACSVLYALVGSHALYAVQIHVGYFAFFVMALYLLDRPARLMRLSVVFVIVSIVLVASNLDKLSSSLRVGMFRAAYFLGDGNDFAWGLVVILPLALYCMRSHAAKLTRVLGLIGAVTCAFGIMATQSRGAALALGAGAVYHWLAISRRKTVGVVIMVLILMGAMAAAPGYYLERLKSVQDYQEDGSAQGRLRAWRAATQMALDYPLGVGANNFNSAYGRFYVPADAAGWGAQRWISAHSVYFKVLGEYGFIGIGLILWLLVANLRENRKSRLAIRANPDQFPIADYWPGYLNMCLVGYAVAAVFLGGITYPHLYMMTALTLSCRRLVEGAQKGATQPAPAAAPAPGFVQAAVVRKPVAGRPAPATVLRRPSLAVPPRSPRR